MRCLAAWNESGKDFSWNIKFPTRIITTHLRLPLSVLGDKFEIYNSMHCWMWKNYATWELSSNFTPNVITNIIMFSPLCSYIQSWREILEILLFSDQKSDFSQNQAAVYQHTSGLIIINCAFLRAHKIPQLSSFFGGSTCFPSTYYTRHV